LEIGLPCLLEDISPQGTISTVVTSAKNEIIEFIKKENLKTRHAISDITVNQYVDEQMLSSLLQQFEYFLSHQKELPILPEQVRDRWDSQLPDRFDRLKKLILEKINE